MLAFLYQELCLRLCFIALSYQRGHDNTSQITHYFALVVLSYCSLKLLKSYVVEGNIQPCLGK